MNILLLIESSEGGGAETVVLSLAEALRDRGHHCIIGLLQEGWLDEQLKNANLKTILIRQKTSYDLACLWNLVRLIQKAKIDVIHAHEFMMNTYGALAGCLTRTPVVTTVHGKNYYWIKQRRRLAYRVVSCLSKMVAVSDDLGCFLAKEVGISKRRLTTIYNGVDFSGCNNLALPREDLEGLRDSLSIPAESAVIGTVGMLVPVKDHLNLLKAMASVIRCFPEAILLICGDGELRNTLKEAACQMGIAGNVRFAGFRNDVFNLLQIMDVYVCSSLSEGLSLSILEAMTTGKPIVATNVGGNPEIVTNEKTGFLVPPSDPQALALKVAWLLHNRGLAQEIGAKGRAIANQKFGRGRMVHAYEQLYRELL